jgi:cobalt-zinc-cadmium efflux system protein
MAAAGVALVVDLITAWLLWSMSKGSLNVKAAFLHNLTDAGASVAVLLGGAAIVWLDWTWVDPVITLIIAGYILYMSSGMIKKTSRILMEGAPADLSVNELKEALQDLDGIENVHHIHVWELDEHHRALEAHVVIRKASSMKELESLKAKVKTYLREHFSIHHSTLEFESTENSCRNNAEGKHCNC